MKLKRKFIKSSLLGLTAITFPSIIKVNADQDYDVVVIGAGAAGLAATEELINSGKKVICLEASNRIGGRALTDNQIFGEPYDLGALWLDNGDTNPFKLFGEKNSNFKKTQIDSNYKDIRKKERKWGISKIKKYKIPFNGALNFWSGPFGEHYIYSVLINRGNEARRPDPMNGFTPDWECDDYIYEVKTRNYTSTGSIGEKALGIPLKYCEIPELYKKPLKIVLVGKMEFEGIHKYGIIKNDNYSQNISEISSVDDFIEKLTK